MARELEVDLVEAVLFEAQSDVELAEGAAREVEIERALAEEARDLDDLGVDRDPMEQAVAAGIVGERGELVADAEAMRERRRESEVVGREHWRRCRIAIDRAVCPARETGHAATISVRSVRLSAVHVLAQVLEELTHRNAHAREDDVVDAGLLVPLEHELLTPKTRWRGERGEDGGAVVPREPVVERARAAWSR
ncbi:MAG: hypothetical protein U0235_00140 [Polyangiaceae bacterium]